MTRFAGDSLRESAKIIHGRLFATDLSQAPQCSKAQHHFKVSTRWRRLQTLQFLEVLSPSLA
jgi:hypothetical protein